MAKKKTEPAPVVANKKTESAPGDNRSPICIRCAMANKAESCFRNKGVRSCTECMKVPTECSLIRSRFLS